MAMNVQQDGDDEERPMAEINTTPLVDVMLVLLIIFLITIPVVNEMQRHKLPQISNIETVSKPQFVILVITENGEYFEGSRRFASPNQLKEYIKTRAVEKPQPEVQIRADRNVRFDAVGRAIYAIQQGGIIKVDFLTEPPPRS